ncbi:hypothetical protein FJZ53_07190 [Candidatus Woesearchaeota archaeon]|nr:hypothetical protein [Candidatus Woesearchaeota archaeon]
MPRVAKDSIIEQLARNNIALQEKTAELITSVKELTKRMDEMVKIFEEAAKHIKEGTDKPMMDKLQNLLEQNKTIAKGLILLEKYVREKSSTANIQQFQPKTVAPRGNL